MYPVWNKNSIIFKNVLDKKQKMCLNVPNRKHEEVKQK
nr:MAG TPA: hypothetical protein [Caudoviricetes sp.]